MLLIIGGAFALTIWADEATEVAFVPRAQYTQQEVLAQNAYQDPAMWYSRPGIGTSDPSRYQPAVAQAAADGPAQSTQAQDTPSFAVFFVHPTSYIPLALDEGAQWNASLGDEEAEDRARLFLRGLASPFNRADEIWAPKYRQATVGAFLTDKPEAQLALDSAYRDVALAFDYFVESVDPETPIVLAGHSQGALHLLTLLQERVAGTPLQGRIAAIYPVGWPISIEGDLPALGFPACATATQPGCISTWSSFTDDGDPSMLLTRYANTPGLDNQPRSGGPILCVNPITGTTGASAPASANLGTLVPDETMASASLIKGAVPARCDASGILRIGDPPEVGSAVLPGGNYHVYDIPLFWANVQRDVVERVKAWKTTR